MGLLREAGERGLSRNELAKGLGASKRTVDRALDLLEGQGARFLRHRVACSERAELRICLIQGPSWDENLSPRSLTALHIAMTAMEQLGTEVWAEHLGALKPLASPHLSAHDHAVFAGLASRIRVQGTVDDPPIIGEEVVLPLLAALGTPGGPWQLEVTYAPIGHEPWTRVVHPFVLTHDVFSGGAFLLVWEANRQRACHLRLSRIERAAVLQVPAHFPDPTRLEQLARTQIGGWVQDEDPFTVEVEIRGESWSRALLEAPPALPEAATRKIPGGVRVTFLATESHAPARWILQFGPDAEVMRPESLRELVKQRLREALARYEVGGEERQPVSLSGE